MFFGTVYSQQVPGKEQSQSILISNGTIHVGNGDLLENAFVGLDNGKISYVSRLSEVMRAIQNDLNSNEVANLHIIACT